MLEVIWSSYLLISVFHDFFSSLNVIAVPFIIFFNILENMVGGPELVSKLLPEPVRQGQNLRGGIQNLAS